MDATSEYEASRTFRDVTRHRFMLLSPVSVAGRVEGAQEADGRAHESVDHAVALTIRRLTTARALAHHRRTAARLVRPQITLLIFLTQF